MPFFARPPELAKPPKPTVLINARLIDPDSGRDEPGGVLIEDGKIVDLGTAVRGAMRRRVMRWSTARATSSRPA